MPKNGEHGGGCGAVRPRVGLLEVQGWWVRERLDLRNEKGHHGKGLEQAEQELLLFKTHFIWATLALR